MHLPDVRTELAAALSAAAGPLAPDMGERFRQTARHLRASELFWVARDMVAVALDASTDLPDWTPAAVLPAPIGLLVWEEGLPTLPAPGLPRAAWAPGPLGVPAPPHLPVDAILWAQHGGQVHLTALTRTSHVRELPGAHLLDLPAVDLWPTISVTPLDATTTLTDEDMTGDGGGLVAMLGATWILMQQPTVAAARRMVPRGRAFRAAQRLGRGGDPVSIIDLRRLEHPDTQRESTDGAGRVYHHRWVVRGHWRQQPYGPGRELRRPTWVPSYVKGPDGAPLLATEHVNVWRR